MQRCVKVTEWEEIRRTDGARSCVRAPGEDACMGRSG